MPLFVRRGCARVALEDSDELGTHRLGADVFTFIRFPGTKVHVERDVTTNLMDSLVILVVEDDPAVQVLIEETLRDAGYEPSFVASGEEAVTLLKGNREHYRALVSDINLKGSMLGWEVARHAREIDPAFPIVYMTGAAADQWASQGVPHSILLNKPFAPAQLVTAISLLLNAGSSSAGPAVA
jgi:CheY-like chemotaxis protein